MGGDNPATNTTELIDLSAAGTQLSAACPTYAPCWVQGPAMSQSRVEMESTLLPNGKVLVDAGSAQDEVAATASLQAEIYDPVSNSFSSAGSNAFAQAVSQYPVAAARWHCSSDWRQPCPGCL